MELYEHQKQALQETEGYNHVAYYHDMGLGKTFTGAEKLAKLDTRFNLVICQKSKIEDWMEHFKTYYDMNPCNLTNVKASDLSHFIKVSESIPVNTVYIINYELAWRRSELKNLEDFTLLLDESSLIQNENAKQSKFIMQLKPKNVILLSGTPTGGKYEKLWSQLNLLGWKISKQMFYRQFVDFHYEDNCGFPLMIIDGYKNEERLKRKMRDYGCHFLKTDEVFDLPEQIHQNIIVNSTAEYKKFKKTCISKEYDLIGDSTLTKMLYERELCGQYNNDKLAAVTDLIESTNDRIIIFYNFNAELDLLKGICERVERPYSIVNGSVKDLTAYESKNACITLIQYQAGAMGLNLQKANKIIYFTPTLSSELFEQSKKRIHRIGQNKTCFYYYLICKSSIEEKIYRTLKMRKDYTEALFESED